MPPGVPGFVGVSLSGAPSSEGAVFLYREAAQVHGAAPRAAWRGGSTLVHVSGRGLEGGEARCRAAGAGELPAHRVSSALLVCEVGAGAGGPAAEMQLEVGSMEQQRLELSWTEDVGVPGVAPASGSEAGGAALQVQGGVGGEVKGVHCQVGTYGPVAGRRVDARSLECLAPAHAPGRVLVGTALNAQVRAPGAEFTFGADAGEGGEVRGEGAAAGGSTPPLPPASRLAPAGAVSERVAAGELALAAGIEVRVGGLEPAKGPAGGGTVVRVLGEGLQHGLACSFGTVVGVTGRWSGGGELECVSPAHAPGRAGVEVEGGVALGPAAEEGDGAAGWVRSRGGAQYSYARDAVFLSVEPGSGPARGGTEVLALGEGLVPGPVSCMVGGRAAPGEAISSEEARCSMPPGVPGFVGVSLSGAPSSEGAVFLYREAAQVHGAAPRAAWRGGSTLVHVSGRGLEGGEARCRAAGAGELPAHRVSSALLVCEVGQGDFSLPDENFYVGSSSYRGSLKLHDGVPQCFAHAMPVFGGGNFECKWKSGTAQLPVEVLASFGNTVVSSLVTSTGSTTFAAPAHAPAPVPVRVGIAGSWPSSGFEIEYAENAAIVSGDVVSLNGGIFEMHLQSFGPGSLFLPGAPDMECTISEKYGTGVVQIRSHVCSIGLLPDPGFSALSFGLRERQNVHIEYSIQKIPVVQSIYPDNGLSSGATVSFVRGGDLVEGSECSYGNHTDPSLFVSSALVRCVSPASPQGRVDEVRLAMNGIAGLGGTFEFQSNIHLNSIGVVPKFGVLPKDPDIHASGPDDGGTETLVHGQNFMERLKTLCRFGTTTVSAHVTEPSRVRCISPAHVDGVVPVEVSQNGLDYSVGGPKFGFYA